MAVGFQRQRVGEVRPSQVIHTFGVGSLIDLPNFTAIVSGLDDWEAPTPQDAVVEERLLALVRNHLGPQVELLVVPPRAGNDAIGNDPFDPESKRGVPVAPFPRWVRCPYCNLIAPLDFGVFKLRSDPWRPDRTSYVHENCQKRGRPPNVVPVRFLRACEHGHLDDFPWVEFVHRNKTDCPSLLRLMEFGVSAETADILVKCDSCGTSRNMVEAYSSDDAKGMVGNCRGRHPHLRAYSKCDQEARAMLAGASNLWFSVTASAIAIPSEAGALAQRVIEHWPLLEHIMAIDVLQTFRKVGQLQAFATWSDDDLWAAIETKRSGPAGEGPARVSELKDEEWSVFSAADPSKNGPDFQLTEEPAPPGYEALIERVVRVERLRVVQAQVGFTRILSPGDFADLAEIPEIRRVPLARRPPTWIPASEVRGEGIFLQFREDALQEWLADPGVRKLDEAMYAAHKAFRRARRIEPAEGSYESARYTMLHSLSHSLIRRFAIECGYGASSLQERIYARGHGSEDGPMAGILLYTAAADAEGTLGGLVGLGKPRELGRHLDAALRDARLCASDPLCAEHIPATDGTTLHGAACHACLFASETSCERGNKYLDRSLLITTVDRAARPFFENVESAHGW